MSHPPHAPWCNHPNNIRWRIQAVKFIIMQFSPRFIPLLNIYLTILCICHFTSLHYIKCLTEVTNITPGYF
jgi:hypothetical protein